MYIINIGLRSEFTRNSYNKVEKMFNDCSYDTRAFLKLNNMERNNIRGATGMQSVTSLNVFSTCILIQLKIVLYGQKRLYWSPKFMSKTIGTVFVMLERGEIFASCKVLDNWRHKT